MSRPVLALGIRLLAAFVASAAITQPRAFEAPLKRFEFQQPHMGTTARIVLYAADAASAQSATDRAFARIGELDARLSDYRDTSELMRLCARAGGPPVEVSADLFTVLNAAQQLAVRTHGAFDVTIGPVTRLWRRARAAGDTPDPARLAAAQLLVGYQNLELSPTSRSVRLTRPGMTLDLGGIAKGFAADQSLETLVRHGAATALVAIGGDIAVGDPPPGNHGWQIAIAPLGTPDIAARTPLTVSRCAISTSGDAEQFLERDGVRYSHIITPETGSAITDRRGVTVVARDGMTADSLATAVTVLGVGRGLALVDDTPGASALIVELTSGVRRLYHSTRW